MDRNYSHLFSAVTRYLLRATRDLCRIGQTPAIGCMVFVTLLAASPTGHANPVQYPVLVYNQAGRGSVEVPVTLTVSGASSAVRVCVTAHQAAYHNSAYVWGNWSRRDDAASLSLNGGAFVGDWNTTSTVRSPDQAFGGFGGAYATVRSCFDLSALGSLNDGVNTLTFRFDGVRDFARSGYRVLEIDIEDGGGNDLITDETYDDPETWSIPPEYDNPSSLAEGAALWNARNTLDEVDGSRSIVASCNDCHANRGLDLKYFNYEREVIVARAVHHGLSQNQGELIAAYVRSQDLWRPDGRETTPLGRPWNPPLQPGPGQSKNSGAMEEDWIAGAGLEWVLPDDDLTARYAFDTNNDGAVTTAEVQAATLPDAEQPLEYHDIPLAIQFPDWNTWLPDVHPFDYAGRSDVEGTDLYQWFEGMDERISVAVNGDPNNEFGTFKNWMECIKFEGGSGCGRSGWNEIFERFDDSHDGGQIQPLADFGPDDDPARFLNAETSVLTWQAVKTIGFGIEHKLFDLGPELFGGETVTNPAHPRHGQPVLGRTDVFFFPSTQSFVFDAAPHKTDSAWNEGASAYAPPGQHTLKYTFSTLWYELQMRFGGDIARHPSRDGGSPIDWGYQQSLLTDAQNSSGVSMYMRNLLNGVFGWQTRYNDYHPTSWRTSTTIGHKAGFSPVATFIRHTIGRSAGTSLPDGNWEGRLAADQNLAVDVLEGALGAFIDFHVREGDVAYVRGDPFNSPSNPVETVSYTPTPQTSGDRFTDYEWANGFYRLPPLMLGWGMNPGTVDHLARWGDTMWPNGNWEQWFSDQSEPDPPSVGLLQPMEGASYPAFADITLEAEAVTPEASIAIIQFLNGNETIGQTTSAPYEMVWQDVEPGTYVLRARVEDSLGRTATSPPVTVSVEASDPNPDTGEQAVALGIGWNLVSSYIAPSDSSIASVLEDILDEVVIVQNETGDVFHPQDEIDTIEYWRSGEAYQIYVTQPVTLSFEGEELEPESTPITIQAGSPSGTSWSQVAYVRTSPMAVGDALNSISEQLVVVKNNQGMVYMPEAGIDQIGELTPGQGYKVYVSSEATLVYPPNGTEGAKAAVQPMGSR